MRPKKDAIEIDAETSIQIVEQIEEEWYLGKPRDGVLCAKLFKWLDSKEDIDIIKLDEVVKDETDEAHIGISFKYFVRSYRLACQKFVEKKCPINGEESKSDITKLLKEKMKKILKISIGDFIYTIHANPCSTHFGQGRIDGLGKYSNDKYSDIWPILSLITDCEIKNNQQLAIFFLQFAKKPFAFTEQHLEKINAKFEKNQFNKSLIDYFCRYITGIAFLYIFFEPARRLSVEFDSGEIKIKPNNGMIHASSVITVLKRLREGDLDLEQAFSPNSVHMLFTKHGVNKIKKAERNDIKDKITTEIIKNFVYGGQSFFVTDKEMPTTSDVKETILDPDSNNVSDDEEEYKISIENAVKCTLV